MESPVLALDPLRWTPYVAAQQLATAVAVFAEEVDVTAGEAPAAVQ